jgi:hypothetical protein
MHPHTKFFCKILHPPKSLITTLKKKGRYTHKVSQSLNTFTHRPLRTKERRQIHIEFTYIQSSTNLKCKCLDQTMVVVSRFMWIVMAILRFKWNSNKICLGLRTYLGLGIGISEIISKVMKWVYFFKIIYSWVSIWSRYIDFEKIK